MKKLRSETLRADIWCPENGVSADRVRVKFPMCSANYSHLLMGTRDKPEGAERHLKAARGKHCCKTIFFGTTAAQQPSPEGEFRKRKKGPLLWGRASLGAILRDNLGEGNSKAVNFAARHTDASQGPLEQEENEEKLRKNKKARNKKKNIKAKQTKTSKENGKTPPSPSAPTPLRTYQVSPSIY